MSENTMEYVQFNDASAAKAAFAFGNFKFKCAICGHIHSTSDEGDLGWCKYNSRIVSAGTEPKVIFPEPYMLALDFETFKKVFYGSHSDKEDIACALERVNEYRRLKDIIEANIQK